MTKIGVLISGWDQSQGIIDNIKKGKIKGEIQIVISNRKDAYGLERAKRQELKPYISIGKNSIQLKNLIGK